MNLANLCFECLMKQQQQRWEWNIQYIKFCECSVKYDICSVTNTNVKPNPNPNPYTTLNQKPNDNLRPYSLLFVTGDIITEAISGGGGGGGALDTYFSNF